jgi:hypothetical protein
MSLGTTQEGPELPESRPTLATTHPHLVSQGHAIIKAIEELSNPDNNWHEGTYSALVAQLPGLFDLVTEFVGASLTARGPNDGVAYWAEQTFKAVQRIEKRTQVPGLVPSEAIKPSWAAVASRPHPGVAREGLALRQVKVHVADTTERQALWTTPNNTILQRVLQGAKGAGVVGVKKLPGGDVVIQTKDRAGRESLAQRSAWLEGVAPSARVIADLYPVMVHGCRLSNVKTTDQQEAIKSLIDQNRNLHPGLQFVEWPGQGEPIALGRGFLPSLSLLLLLSGLIG